MALFKRARAIGARYGLTAAKMNGALVRFVSLLQEHNCSATFPVTSVALARNKDVIRACQAQGIEFAIHGYAHVDYSALSLDEQVSHLKRACAAFEQSGIKASGFRCPYLRWNPDTLTAVQQQGLAYDSSQALAWDVVDGFETEAYRRVLDFYNAQAAVDCLALPRLIDNLVCIPYCLPDDEALVDRLRLSDAESMKEIWLRLLRRTYESGELFTLGLHPERIALCQEALGAVLGEARSLSPSVWIACLAEIAGWWRSLAGTTHRVVREDGGSFRLTITGPAGVTVLARSLAIEAATEPWAAGYQRVLSTDFGFRADRLPFIGLLAGGPSGLADFLQQQGFLVERGDDARSCALYLERTDFAAKQGRSLLALIERTDCPLVRLSRWPNGTRSALAVTGDVDALTLWDYGLRLFGK